MKEFKGKRLDIDETCKNKIIDLGFEEVLHEEKSKYYDPKSAIKL
jgi:hypothetical protein